MTSASIPAAFRAEASRAASGPLAPRDTTTVRRPSADVAEAYGSTGSPADAYGTTGAPAGSGGAGCSSLDTGSDDSDMAGGYKATGNRKQESETSPMRRAADILFPISVSLFSSPSFLSSLPLPTAPSPRRRFPQ